MKQRNLEIKVGIFVLVSLVAMGVLIVAFGRFGSFYKSDYQVTVRFKNTSGIIKNSQVLYRGAKVGTVQEAPKIAEGGDYVEVPLSIREDIRIDKSSKFKVGSHGLLGDRFVDVVPPQKDTGDYVEPGAFVEGTESKSLGDVTEKLDGITDTIQKDLLTAEMMNDVQDAVSSAKSLLKRMDKFMSEAEDGKGVLYTLMKDQEMASDLKVTMANMKQLSINLRSRGVLFYKDLSDQEDESNEPSKIIRRR